MPTGVYYRSPELRRQVKKNLDKGRTAEVREKSRETMINKVVTEEWKLKVSEATKKAMMRKDVRKRHLKGLKKAIKKHGINFRGGNGQQPVAAVRKVGKILIPLGFIPEYPIKTKKHKTGLNAPTSYKVDFGDPENKVAFELDGPSHSPRERREKDRKKDEVLKSLGWIVYRIKHK